VISYNLHHSVGPVSDTSREAHWAIM
jgi:hypothetical protein